MQTRPQPSTRIAPLLLAWSVLLALTLLSLLIGEAEPAAAWLPALVAAIIWVKAWVVARYFLETRLSHPFIRRLTWTFIGFAPVALVLTDLFGARLAAQLQL